MDLFSIGFVVCTLSGIACFWLFFKCITGSRRSKKRKEKQVMYTALFVVSLIMFGYMMYVLIKPEKF